ncbi:hypothetical protein HD806DRAFT_481340 [Xylariaceae sp. AK1471]|nr:hypothetical protein HD806DRAFT_481340 [Xylariaceae sp. AK1471]
MKSLPEPTRIFIICITIDRQTPFTMPCIAKDIKDHKRMDCNSKKKYTMCWVSLPAELRLMILAILAHEHRGLASYSPVCQEWQIFMEEKNFRQLKLQVSCLDDFQYMVTRQRKLVHHVWLNIDLPRYTCRSCKWQESESWISRNDSIIRKAISKLFSILSTWDPADSNLTLELSVQSPSDSEHWFKNYYFGTSIEDKHTTPETENQLQEVAYKWHHPKHNWIDGRQVATPNSQALLRLFGTVHLHFPEALSEVRVVTSFVIRRQVRRRFTATTLRLLFEKLPRLEHIIWEPWREWSTPINKYYDREYRFMIEACLPKTLKRISVFQDFNEDHIASLQILGSGSIFSQIDPIRHADPAVGAAFAYRSLSLEELSASYMVDARHFFQELQPLWTWNYLQSLVLTSGLLTGTASRTETSDLLHHAGLAARSMPRLHTMAIWNGGKGEACAFIYRKKNSGSSITWRSTWDLELGPSIVEAWEKVATESTQSRFWVEKHQLRGDSITSHGDAICQLDLPYGVIDPASLWQIRRECS